jgi:hypothetical protein
MTEEGIAESLHRRGVAHLCHLTPCHRLPSIFEHRGLLPLSERQFRGIEEHPQPNYWGTAEKQEGLAGYVVCGFMVPWGMCLTREEEMVVILLDAVDVCSAEGVLFCPTNSPRGAVGLVELMDQTGVEHLDNCFSTQTRIKPSTPRCSYRASCL